MLYDWSMESNYITSKGSKNSVVCAREGGANTPPLFLAAHFAKQNTKFDGGESKGGAGIHFPQPPFSSRPARAVRNFAQKRFELRSRFATNCNLAIFPPEFSTNFPNPNRLFWKASGGSELQSNSQMKFVSDFSFPPKAEYEASFLIPRFMAKG